MTTTNTATNSTVQNYASIQNTINNETSGNTPATAASSTATAGLDSLSSNYTDFISLLTTQLKNQDPTSPVDTTAFTQQLIGFSQVQQQVDTNQNLAQLISLTQNSGVNNSVSYINQLVNANTNNVNIKTGKPQPTIAFNLPSASTSVSISIADSTGKVIKTYSGSGAQGENTIPWDGTDSTGTAVPDGDYTFSVTATDNTGAAISGITTDVTDYVSSVAFQNGVSTLYFGDIAITSDKVNSIKGYYSQATIPTNGSGSSGDGSDSTSTPSS